MRPGQLPTATGSTDTTTLVGIVPSANAAKLSMQTMQARMPIPRNDLQIRQIVVEFVSVLVMNALIDSK
jgi:hypothetical protein